MRRRILALAFDSPADARQAMDVALRLHERREIAVHDAVMVTRREDGEVVLDEPVDSTAVAAAVPAALVGALIGALFAGPAGFLTGAVVAGAIGILLAKKLETGISERLLRELADSTKPGQTILALETGPAEPTWHDRCCQQGKEDTDEDHDRGS